MKLPIVSPDQCHEILLRYLHEIKTVGKEFNVRDIVDRIGLGAEREGLKAIENVEGYSDFVDLVKYIALYYFAHTDRLLDDLLRFVEDEDKTIGLNQKEPLKTISQN